MVVIKLDILARNTLEGIQVNGENKNYTTVARLTNISKSTLIRENNNILNLKIIKRVD